MNTGRIEGEVSFKAFARILGERSPSYVTQLKGEGRLVLSADGKRVRVAESLVLVRATSDPGKAGVVARHAAGRGGDLDPGAASTAAVPDEGAGGDLGAPSADPVEQSHHRRWVAARADKEEANALAAKRDYRRSMDELMEASEVEHAVRGAVAAFRGSLENLPNTLAPELSAMTDEGRIRVLLSEAFEHALEELSRQFTAIGRREEAA